VSESRRGTLLGFAAYLLWGVFPLYFHALAPSGAIEVLASRIVWSLLLCLLVLAVLRQWAWIRPLFGQPKVLAGLALAAGAIALNWGVYVAAVLSGHAADAALGYFLNPLLTVALGVLVLGERLRPMQWWALGVGAAAAAYLTVVGGQVPVVALTLACSFAVYGLVKKRVGASLAALPGLTVETAVLAPFAAAALVVLAARGETTYAVDAPWHPILLLLTGPVTVVPLVMFAAAARRVPLVTIGLLQFVAPVMQLLSALVLGERPAAARWVGFAVVWVALALLTVDSLRHRAGPGPEPAEPV